MEPPVRDDDTPQRPHTLPRVQAPADPGNISFLRPRPERSAARTLWTVFGMLAALLALYRVGETWLDRREAAGAASVAAPYPAPAVPKPATPAQNEFRRPLPPPPAQAAAVPAPGQGVVMKCQGAGHTLYSDGPCPPGTTAHTVNLPVNVVQSEKRPAPDIAPPLPLPPSAPPAPLAGPDGPGAQALRQQECQWLDAEIQRLDALARQPQSGAMQDHLRHQRKQARDRQFALRC